MIVKVAVTAALIACAGCEIDRRPGHPAVPATSPNSAINTILQTPADAMFIDENCYQYEACRTTAHGLGV
jgi:hypothetical protein